MDLELRPVTSEETASFLRAVDAAFSQHLSDEDLEDYAKVFDADRSLACLDRGRIVGTAGAGSFELTLPARPGHANPVIAAAAVGYVGVLPSHRRRGLLTTMMNRQLDDVAARGEAIAILTASEGAIYRRFGYGPASFCQEVCIDANQARFAAEPADPGGMRLIDAEEAAKVLPEVFDRVRRKTPGDINRSPALWEQLIADREPHRHGFGAAWYALHETAGSADGFVRYRVKAAWDHGIATSTLRVADFAATTPGVALAQWSFLLSVDLVSVIEWDNVPMDWPVPFALGDLRQARFSVGEGDFVWVRFLDIPAALAARGYPVDGRLVFDVTDDFRPAGAGRYELVVSGGAGTVSRLGPGEGGHAALALDVSDLGSAYLGGVRFSTLAGAGRVRSSSPEMVALADAVFASTPLPWCATGF
jgi:predicted acetyltransferase